MQITALSRNINNLKDLLRSIFTPQEDKNFVLEIWIGIGILLFSLILPKLLYSKMYGVLDIINESISNQDSGLLLLASAELVLSNTIRHVPIYAGVFIMAEGLYSIFKIKQLGFIVSLIAIPIIYKCISIIYNISFVFGGPDYLTVLTILILHLVTVRIKPIFIKIIIISLFLFGLDWLDIVPLLSDYGFGKGELAISIKAITDLLQANYLMNFVGLTFSITIISAALILANVVVNYYHRLLLAEESQIKEEKLRRFQMEAIKSRYFREIKHLVHDLKTPLVTIQGLSDVIGMQSNDKSISEYTDKISTSVEKMSEMISEILYDNKIREVEISELFDFIKSQLLLTNIEYKVKFDYLPDLKIYANKVRLSRAIINLIENGLKATNFSTGEILVKVAKENEKILILVKDNGIGIPEDKINQIWEAGFTTSLDNTGLGLNFVKQVIDMHCGQIIIESEAGCGTEARIYLPEVRDND